MKFTQVDIKKYTLPLARPLTIGSRQLTSREGIIISITDDNGLTGYGEAAPLPGLHKETLAEVTSQILPLKTLIKGADFATLIKEVLTKELYPSVRLAIEMAIFNLRLERGKMRDDVNNVTIPVNGLVMAQDEDLFEQIKSLLAEGYRSIKIKVARQPLDRDIETILNLRELIAGAATIRLDANRLWTLPQALDFCNAIGPAAIEYIEEPLKDISEYPEFFDSTSMPIALDETLLERTWNQLDDFKQAAAFVLKPSLLGGHDATAGYVACARFKDIIPVMSCTFQSDITLRTFAIMAADFKMLDTPAGLDTLKWFKQPLLEEGFEITNGRIDIGKLLDTRPKIREGVLLDVE
jgi:O-succinylbenzoate synthase